MAAARHRKARGKDVVRAVARARAKLGETKALAAARTRSGRINVAEASSRINGETVATAIGTTGDRDLIVVMGKIRTPMQRQ